MDKITEMKMDMEIDIYDLKAFIYGIKLLNSHKTENPENDENNILIDLLLDYATSKIDDIKHSYYHCI